MNILTYIILNVKESVEISRKKCEQIVNLSIFENKFVKRRIETNLFEPCGCVAVLRIVYSRSVTSEAIEEFEVLLAAIEGGGVARKRCLVNIGSGESPPFFAY